MNDSTFSYYLSLAAMLMEKQDPGHGPATGQSQSWTKGEKAPKKKFADDQSIKVSTKHRAQGHKRSIKSTTPSKPFGDKPSFRGELAKKRAEAHKGKK